MIKASASYNCINPNFVIQNIDEPKNWSHPVFAVLKNILMRGCPTLPSLYLRNQFGTPEKKEKFLYYRDFSNLNWSGIIKGGYSNPALNFYNNILPKIHPMAGTFIPECPVRDIIPDTSKNFSGQVDFYSPLYNAVIEIDGKQHEHGEQFLKDNARDDLFKRYKITLIRIPVNTLSNTEKVRKLLVPITYKKLQKSQPTLNAQDVTYSLAIRLQTLLLYLYGTEKISLTKKQFKINLYNDFIIENEKIKIILDDFFLWVKNITALQNINFTQPDVQYCIYDDYDLFYNSVGIKIDISLTKTYCAISNKEIYYIRNDYFDYETYSSIRINDKIIFTNKKNYFQVAYSQITYNLNKEQHNENLQFILQNISTYNDYRANQLDIIIETLNNRCAIGILPTGAGKSLCYQITALLIPSMTLVIAPLKLLMVDQHEHLCLNLGLNHSTYINSSHTEHLELFEQGHSLVTLISPERFFSEKFSKAFTNVKNNLHIGFIVIDEAHCLSEWGHDFRTSYLCLSHNLSKLLPADTFLMALTGTASHSVFRDIENEFYYFKQKPTKSIFAEDMRRNNLTLHIEKFPIDNNDNNIFKSLEDNIFPTLLGLNKDKTIVFTKTKNSNAKDETASACIPLSNYFSKLSKEYNRENTVAFFAGGDDLQEVEKDRILSEFRNDTNLRVLFATKAFGMGIDIPNIRKTIHYGLPSSMESLYQQIGRAGRDGKNADCYVLFREEQQNDYDFFFSSRELSIEDIYKNQRRLKELSTNFFFIQNANLDVSIEKKVVTRIDKGISLINSKGSCDIDCLTICKTLINDIQDNHLAHILGWNDKNEEVTLSPSANIIIERALYRLYLLGEIEMWTVVYDSDVSNPRYGHLTKTSYTEEQKLQRLVEHIERYESRARSLPDTNTFDSRLDKLLTWSYDNFVLERIKSMKTLYDWCIDFTNSNNFMRRLADYFSNDPVYVRLIDKNATIEDLIAALKRNTPETKLRIARLLETYENIDFLNYLSGITRLRLNEFSDFDGERRLDMSFEGIKLLSQKDRLKLFAETLEYLESNEMKDIFIDKWLQYLPTDVRWIYNQTKNQVAENFLLSDFYDKLLKIKEKINAKLR